MARRVAEVWAEAVGPEIAANARPLQLRQGRLVVSTSSSAWAQSLQFMGEAVRARLNESLETDEIRTIFFRHAGWEAAPDHGSTALPARASSRPPGADSCDARESDVCGESGATKVEAGATHEARAIGDSPVAAGFSAGDPQDLTEEQRAALEGVRDLDVSPELREVIGRAMKAAFVREERQ